MEVFQIGSLAILPKWVLLGGAILFGLIFVKIWMKRSQEAKLNKKVFDVLTNSLFIGFFIWKGSLLLIDPLLVLKSPFSLLYFSGGSDGLIISIICTGIYFILQSRKSNLPGILIFQSVFLFSFVVLSLYHLLFAFLLDANSVYHFLLGSFSIVILVLSLLNKKWLLQTGLVSQTILFSFLNVILSFVFFKSDDRLLIFSIEQWFFVGLIIFSLFIDNGRKKSNSN